MTAVRWAAFTLAALCITGVGFAGGDITGLWVLGMAAFVVWIFANGMHRLSWWVGDMPEELSEWDERDRNGCRIPDCPSCFVDHSWDTEDDEEKAA